MQIIIEDLDFSKINPSLKHLSEDDIRELIQKYYEGKPVQKLKKTYEIISSVALKQLLPEKIINEKCIYCDVFYNERWHFRTEDSNAPYCTICKHCKKDFCTCKNCKKKLRELKEVEEIKKRELIRSTYNEKNYERFPEIDLTLEDKLYLSVLLRGGLNESLTLITPLAQIKERLTSTSSFTIELVKTLTGKNIIIPHPNSEISSFVEEDNFPNIFYAELVVYRLNIDPFDTHYHNMIQRLLYPSKEHFESNGIFCYEMWKKISLNESLEYLLYSMNKVGFDFNPGKKTIKLFEHLLGHYSVAQLYSLIYRGVANSTKLYLEKKLPKKHAANTVITYCETQGERALAEGWTVTKYRRNYDLPESIISKVFFTAILKIAHLGFDEKPSKL